MLKPLLFPPLLQQVSTGREFLRTCICKFHSASCRAFSPGPLFQSVPLEYEKRWSKVREREQRRENRPANKSDFETFRNFASTRYILIFLHSSRILEGVKRKQGKPLGSLARFPPGVLLAGQGRLSLDNNCKTLELSKTPPPSLQHSTPFCREPGV